MNDQDLTAAQRAMIAVWERHTGAEFSTRDVDATMATMTANPFVNHVPLMTGGVGRDAVRSFYTAYFIPGQPPDTTLVPVRRTVGADCIVDELIYTFTHTIEIPWMLPGIAPTGRRVEVPVVAVVEFEDGKIAGERIYWDQASALAQIGLLDEHRLPITGAEAARKVLDPGAEPSNELIARTGGTRP
jgi:carboxymethylenebutenolidase